MDLAASPTEPVAPEAQPEEPATAPEVPPEVPEPVEAPQPAPFAEEEGSEPRDDFDAEAVPSPAEPFWTKELEKKLVARLPVWIGAAALALAGGFLVKLSFDRGWLGPTVRVALGVLFGLALLAAGEWLRRSSRVVAQGCSAAGIAVLFFSFYAGVNLYSLISPVVGFLLMALTTAVAVGLSLRHGPMVAVLGLVGGLLTPYLMSTGEADPKILFPYLLLLQAGILAVSRRRGWWPLTAVSFVGGLLWILLWLFGVFEAEHSVWLGLFLLSTVALFLASGLSGRGRHAERHRQVSPELNRLVALGGFVGLAALMLKADYTTQSWIFLGILSAGSLALARLRPSYHLLAWVSVLAPLALLGDWALGEPELDRFFWTAACVGSFLALATYAALWKSGREGRWAALCAVSGIGTLLIAYLAGSLQERELSWGVVCLGLAVLYLLAAVPVARARARAPSEEGDPSEGLEGALAAVAVAVTAFASLAVPMELERQWLTVAWALEVVALVLLAGRLRVPILRRLAWIVGLMTAVRLLLNPAVLAYPIGEHPVLNWLTYGYGVPLIAFGVAAFLAYRQGDTQLARALEWGSLLLGVYLVILLIRQYFHPGSPGSGGLSFIEAGTITLAWLLLAWGALEARRRWPVACLRPFASAAAGLAIASFVLLEGLATNPAWNHDAVGRLPVLNGVLWSVGLPTVLLVVVAKALAHRQVQRLPGLCRVTALAGLFAFVTLEIRQAFRGNFLDASSTSGAESYAYSASWILLAVAWLVAGIVRKGRLLRLGSLLVMLLAVGKVFLVDMAGLEGFLRVFAFLRVIKLTGSDDNRILARLEAGADRLVLRCDGCVGLTTGCHRDLISIQNRRITAAKTAMTILRPQDTIEADVIIPSPLKILLLYSGRRCHTAVLYDCAGIRKFNGEYFENRVQPHL